MCIACEMGFWMAMDEPPPVAVPPKRKVVRADNAFACDAPEAKPAKPVPRRKAAPSKPRRRATKPNSNPHIERERKS